MEKENKLMDTTLTGAILVLWFVLPSVILIPWDQESKSWVAQIFWGNDKNLLAKWVAAGVLAHVLGSLISVFEISFFSRPFENEDARKCLKDNLSRWINDKTSDHGGKPDKQMCNEARNAVAGLEPDAIFAWIHYSDPRKDLIDWGRRKLHYAYLAKNWMLAMVLGGVSGLIFAVYLAWIYPKFSETDFRMVGLIGFIVFSLVFLVRLRKMRKDNIKWDNDMIAIYVAGRIWPGLEERFLPHSVRQKEVPPKLPITCPHCNTKIDP